MWYYETSDDGIAISSRVRIARNISDTLFPHMLDRKQSDDVISKVFDSIKKGKKIKDNSYECIRMSNMDEITRHSLVESHVISKEFADNTDKGAVITNSDCSVSVMINEEDHIRVQGFSTGFNIDDAYKKAVKVIEKISKEINYAEHEKYGYLTCCPTNVGSGVRISVMLHLPALSRLGYISKLLEEAASIGIAIRGLYGENTSAYGHIFQISNQKTLGVSDEDTIARVKLLVTSIIAEEDKARKMLMKNGVKIEDEVFRSLGLLKNARIISTAETMKLLSDIKLGISIGLIEGVLASTVQKLVIDVNPNMLQIKCKEVMDEGTRDIKRAEYIRRELD